MPAAVPRRRWWPLAAVVGLTALLYVGSAPISDLYDELDTQYSGAAREMVRSGDWLVPTNNYLPRLQKPPLVYWLTAPSLLVFGENEFACRLPTALIMCLLTALVYLIGERLGGPKRGLMAGLAVAASVGWFIFGKMVMPEAYLTCFVTGAFYCILCGYEDESRRRRWYLGAWAFAGLAAMSKGLHGLAYPLVAAAALAVLNPHARAALRPLFSWRGVLVFLAIWAPWYAAMEIKFPGFFDYHFINEQIGHVTGTHYPQDDTPIGFNQFILQHGIWFFPWTLYFPAALVIWFRHLKDRAEDPLPERLLLAWIGVVGVAMIISTRQDYYGMCGWPAFALWLSQLWTAPRPGRRVVRNLIRGGLIVFLLIGMAGLVAAALEEHWLNGGAPPSVIPAASRDNFINAIEGFSANSWRHLLPVMWAAFGSLTVGAAAALWLAWRGRETATAFALTAAMIVPLFGAAKGMSVMAPYFSLADVARYVNKNAGPADKVLCENEAHAASSLFFYLDRRVHWLDVPSQIEFACREHHIGEDMFVPEDALPPMWNSAERVFIIIEESRVPYWAEKVGVPAGSLKPLATSGTRWLISNR
ncbi:MAG: glycosyltransferase family 39 protein [Verrucomicrobia bacterium]|nr:glycosyltransferase family 39 protein [Verrucomicrobiota bacterium]